MFDFTITLTGTTDDWSEPRRLANDIQTNASYYNAKIRVKLTMTDLPPIEPIEEKTVELPVESTV